MCRALNCEILRYIKYSSFLLLSENDQMQNGTFVFHMLDSYQTTLKKYMGFKISL